MLCVHSSSKQRTHSGIISPLTCTLFMFRYFLPSLHSDPTTLPKHEQEMRAARVLRTSYSLLWYHLDASKVLPQLLDKSIINESLKKKVESYQQKCGQNAAVINALFTVEHLPEGLLAICDTLQTTPAKEHIAQHILQGVASAHCLNHLLYNVELRQIGLMHAAQQL